MSVCSKAAAGGIGLRSRTRGVIAGQSDAAPHLPGLRDVVRTLHPHQSVHPHTKNLFDPQCHLTRKIGVAVQEIRQSRTRYLEYLRSSCDGQAKRLENPGSKEIARIGR